jgi:hypothetical protein
MLFRITKNRLYIQSLSPLRSSILHSNNIPKILQLKTTLHKQSVTHNHILHSTSATATWVAAATIQPECQNHLLQSLDNILEGNLPRRPRLGRSPVQSRQPQPGVSDEDWSCGGVSLCSMPLTIMQST